MSRSAGIAGFIGCALLASTPAFSTDIAAQRLTKAGPMRVQGWTGFYLSGGAGYGMWDASQKLIGGGLPPGLSEHTGGRGYFGTVGGGYDWQFNSSWVGGIFADAQFGDISGNLTAPAVFAFGNTKNSLNYAAGARLGYLVAPNVLSYVNAGYSHAEFSGTDILRGDGLSTPATTPKFSRDGWFIGGGFENSLNIFGIAAPGWFMKSEYRVAEYNSRDVAVIVPVVGAQAADIRFKPTIQTVSTSLVYRFNANGIPAPVSAPLYTKALATPVSNWTGFYVGGGGGYGMSTADNVAMLFGDPNGVSVRTGGRGAFGTVSGGYDQQFNSSWVAGIFADAQFGNIKATITPPAFGVAGTTKNDLNYAVGARIGYLVAPNVLSYVNGGYSHADFKGADLSLLSNGNVGFTVGKTHFDGWFLGGGVENSLNIFGVTAPGWFMKTEYRVAEYNRKNVDVFDSSGASIPLAVAFKPYVQTVSSSLVYRFNLGH